MPSRIKEDGNGERQRPPLAVVTGASSGIGLELAREFAGHGFDLVIAAEDEGIEVAAAKLRKPGGMTRSGSS